MKKTRFNRYNAVARAIIKDKKPITDLNTGKIANPVKLNISNNTLKRLKTQTNNSTGTYKKNEQI